MKEHNEKLEAGEVVIQNRFLRWLDNFWYHYKWPVLVVAFFVAISLVCFAQCARKEYTDMTVTYAGRYSMKEADHQNLREILEGLTPYKEDGSERQSAQIVTYIICSEDESRENCTDEEGDLDEYAFQSSKMASIENLKAFSNFVMTGESAIWLVSEYVYQAKDLKPLCVPLSDSFESLPDGVAYDAYAIRLCETELYRYYDVLKFLPEDTLLLLPRQIVLPGGKSANDENYRDFVELYRAIVEFEAP